MTLPLGVKKNHAIISLLCGHHVKVTRLKMIWTWFAQECDCLLQAGRSARESRVENRCKRKSTDCKFAIKYIPLLKNGLNIHGMSLHAIERIPSLHNYFRRGKCVKGQVMQSDCRTRHTTVSDKNSLLPDQPHVLMRRRASYKCTITLKETIRDPES